jgi:hypothetical protein
MWVCHVNALPLDFHTDSLVSVLKNNRWVGPWKLTHTHMSWVCSLSTWEAYRIIFALFYVRVYLVGLLKNKPVLGIVTFCQICYAAQVHKRTEPKMAIINNRMENKMALIHNYLFRHPSLFWLCTKEMVVISINRTFKNWQKSGNKSHKISLLYFKFTKAANMWNTLSHHLRTLVVLLKSLESPWWVPTKEWVAPFGRNFPIWWPKKKGGDYQPYGGFL